MFSQSNKPCYVSANFLYSVPPRVLGERLFMNGTRTGSQTKTLPIPFRRGKKLIPPTQREEIEHDLKAKKKLRQETGSCVNAWRRPAEFFFVVEKLDKVFLLKICFLVITWWSLMFNFWFLNFFLLNSNWKFASLILLEVAVCVYFSHHTRVPYN